MNGLLRHREPSLLSNLSTPLTRLHEEIDHAMQDFYNLFESKAKSNVAIFENLRLSPSLDIIEDKTCFKLEVEMPGIGEEDIKISANENVLTIQCEKTTSRKDEKKNFLNREITYGRYERTVALPPSANVEAATASFKKGMLWVTIPKKAGAKGKVQKIAVQGAK